jgi:hypothetical protein
MNVRSILSLLVLTPLLAAAGCNTQTADNSATAPAAPIITEPTFTGTLSVSQTRVYTFSVVAVGPLTVTMTAAGPPPTIAVGLVVGTPTFSTTGTICSPISNSVNATASTTPQISGTTTSTGSYCLAVFDPGTLTGDITYSIVVTHT